MTDPSAVKVGDVLALFPGGYGKQQLRKVAVTRTTPTIIFIGNTGYQRKTGRRRGGDIWTNSWVEWWDDGRHLERYQASLLHDAQETLRRLNFSTLTMEQCKAIATIIAPKEISHD